MVYVELSEIMRAQCARGNALLHNGPSVLIFGTVSMLGNRGEDTVVACMLPDALSPTMTLTGELIVILRPLVNSGTKKRSSKIL
jgi:hypothetical protein